MDTQDNANERQVTRAAMPEATPAASPYVLAFEIKRTWAGLPGATLIFPVRMYLSGELLIKREATIGLVGEERKAYLIDFRIRVLADVLEVAPSGFPDFPDKVTVTPSGGSPVETTALTDRAYQFFSRKDAAGRLVFALLVEDVMREYWDRAIPDPTLPASESTQGGRDTSTSD